MPHVYRLSAGVPAGTRPFRRPRPHPPKRYVDRVYPSATITRVLLARHGDAVYPTGCGSGDSGGVLSEVGRDQAHALGERIGADGVAAIFCSQLSRARETATIVSDVVGLPVQVKARGIRRRR